MLLNLVIFRQSAVLLVILLILSGCGAASTAPPIRTAALPTVPSPTGTALSATVTSLPSTATGTPTAAFTPTPVLSLTPTLTPAQPPQPTTTQTPSVDSGGRGVLRMAGCGKQQGSVESKVIQSGEYGAIAVRIYLPPCYTPRPAVRYPALYLLHGMNADDAQWERLGVPQAADALINEGQARPFMVIMPREDLSAQDPDISQFDDWLVNTLVPWVDSNYATCIERECRAIGGLSRGSGWAFRIGLTDWRIFGAIGMHSFSPFPGDLEAMDSWLQAFTAVQRPRLYMDIGAYDQAVPDAQQFEQKLTDLRFAHEWHLNDGAHNEDYWRAHVPDYLRWYSEGWR